VWVYVRLGWEQKEVDGKLWEQWELDKNKKDFDGLLMGTRNLIRIIWEFDENSTPHLANLFFLLLFFWFVIVVSIGSNHCFLCEICKK
jgi:hypothetical protein